MNGASSETTERDAARWAEAEAVVIGNASGSPGSQGWRSPSRRPVLIVTGVVAVVVLRAAAEVLLVQNKNTRPTMLGLALVTLGRLVQSTGGFGLSGSVVVLVGCVWVLVLQPRDAGRLRTFLAEHPAPPAVSGV